MYDKVSGKMVSNRSLKYHVPLASDIPVEFNVKFRYNYRNPNGVLGSKSEYIYLKMCKSPKILNQCHDNLYFLTLEYNITFQFVFRISLQS